MASRGRFACRATAVSSHFLWGEAAPHRRACLSNACILDAGRGADRGERVGRHPRHAASAGYAAVTVLSPTSPADAEGP